MIDVDRIKESIDCRDLIAHDLGKPKYHNRSYSTYKCPLHHEEKGFSLVVYHDHWHCFGKCNHGGDAIAWLMEYHRLTFREACERLTSGDLPQTDRSQTRSSPRPQRISEPPDALWQMAARQVVDRAVDILHSPAGQSARHYLENERGLTTETIRDSKLGYIPGHHRTWKEIFGLKVPCGITIPWIVEDTIWGIKVRREAGEQRYQQVAGGNIKGSLYLADAIQPGLPLLITEGEFDALIAQQAGAGIISAVALGSAANKHINPRWYPKFLAAPSILVCMDDDAAGQSAAEQLGTLSQAVRCVRVPQGKDMNDFYLQAGRQAVHSWIIELAKRDL